MIYEQRPPEAFDNALEAVERAGEIIKRVRGMVERGKAATRPEDIKSLLQQTVKLLAGAAAEAGVSCSLKGKSIQVSIDAVQIQQVALNLMRNAIEAMAGQPKRFLSLSIQKAGNFAEICISDTGSGLPEDRRKELFAPYKSSKVEGLGVGLSISRTIIEAHGGMIWAEDNPEGGTVFRFTVPLTLADPPSLQWRSS